MIALMTLAGCAGGTVSSGSGAGGGKVKAHYKVGKPYKIKGRWYHPKEDFSYEEVGVASWYGPNFHGKSTANGEVFNKYEMTAAHRTLPLPSVVKVTNLANGKSVRVRVNDRGPFAHNRIIDVSYAAAKKLGFVKNGVAKVKVEIVADESYRLAAASGRRGPVPGDSVMVADASQTIVSTNEEFRSQDGVPQEWGERIATRSVTVERNAEGLFLPIRKSGKNAARLENPARNPNQQMRQALSTSMVSVEGAVRVGDAQGYYVQAGAFTSRVNADRVRAQLAASGDSPTVSSVYSAGQQLHRVRIGPMASAEQADRKLRSVLSEGFKEARVVSD